MSVELVLNPDIANLDTDEKLKARKGIYEKLLKGMSDANDVTPPDFSIEPYASKTGEIWVDPSGKEIELTIPHQDKISAKIAEISLIQMKNSAYLFASVIDTAATTAATGIDTSDFLQKSGDAMTGSLQALHSFKAGLDGNTILGFVKDNATNKYSAHIYGSLIVDDDATISGQLNMGDGGIYFANHQSIYYGNNTLNINNDHISLIGDVEVNGTFKLGDVEINQNGIYWDGKEFYHNGNSNNKDADWTMKDAHVYGDLTVDGAATYNGRLTALQGFDLGENGDKLFYSNYDAASGKHSITLATDMNIVQNHGIMFDGQYIIHVRGGGSNVVSFSAPGRILNLGDSSEVDGNKIATEYITLQADVYTKDGKLSIGSEPIISTTGAGYFPDGLKADTGSGVNALRTYHHSSTDYGVMFPRMIALGDEYGVKLSTQNNNETAMMTIPYTHVVGDQQVVEHKGYSINFGPSNSSWHYPVNDVENDISLHFDTEGEYFIFDKPVEASTFSINSLKYKTQLRENALFLREGIFIEGVTDGMAFTGNAYFNDNLQSQRFASGFAGYGWGIIQGDFAGGYHATFDELTIRKKMRVYELEVQKISATNGSLWISDSCSGDLVEEITETV